MSFLEWNVLVCQISPAYAFPGKRTVFSEITTHSSRVRPSGLFFAISGTQARGFDFIKEAIKNGAEGLVVEEFFFPQVHQMFPETTCLGVSDVRLALAQAAFLLFPKAPKFLAAVTGTNGKTSVAHFTRVLWGALKQKAASMGTLGLCLEGLELEIAQAFPHHHTTPDPLTLYPSLDLLASKEVAYCILEASSHGLEQKRLHGLRFDVGIFTSFSQDHLDYHSDMGHYWEAKVKLFRDLLVPGGMALLNAQLPYLEALQALCLEKKLRVWTYGKGGKDIDILNIIPRGNHQYVTIRFLEEEFTLDLPFSGTFQVENFLAALGIVHLSGVSVPDVLKVAGALTPVPGRLECIGRSVKGGEIYVDFAHTPDALQTVLVHLRNHTPGKIHLVFGCGGDRDPGKRLEMGKIASFLADHIIVTDDNPRHESPGRIRSQILQGCPEAEEIGDRKWAIQKGIEKLARGDTLLIAGKGHEASQIIGSHAKEFDDRVVARQILETLKGAIN